MKKYIYMAVAAIAALSSCSSDNDLLSGETGKKALTFTATMESDATRATYNSSEKCAQWEAGDQISVNGKTYNAQSAGLTTTFKAATEGQEAEGTTYNAYFACTYNGTTATLPAEVSETWANGKFNMPMYATSTTTDLAFKNLCGVLKITVKSDQIDQVKKIKVSSTNKAVSGAFTVDGSNAAVLSEPNTASNTLTVTYTDAVETTAGGVVFYVAVPAQTYQKLKICLSADGITYTKSMTTKDDTDIPVARNKIYPITFANNAPITTGTAKRTGRIDVKWVQLWEDGPKFAEYNVGATSVTDYGGYYYWGGSIDKDPNRTPNRGSETLEGDDDTATKRWSKNWRMPTKQELQDLLDNCDVTWTDDYNGTGVKGRIYTGKGDYECSSLFLPAAGCADGGWRQNEEGYYWSSDPSLEFNNYPGFCMSFRNNWQGVGELSRYESRSVRAVLSNNWNDEDVPAEEDPTPYNVTFDNEKFDYDMATARVSNDDVTITLTLSSNWLHSEWGDFGRIDCHNGKMTINVAPKRSGVTVTGIVYRGNDGQITRTGTGPWDLTIENDEVIDGYNSLGDEFSSVTVNYTK